MVKQPNRLEWAPLFSLIGLGVGIYFHLREPSGATILAIVLASIYYVFTSALLIGTMLARVERYPKTTDLL